MSGPVWRRRRDEALALGGSSSNVRSSKGNSEDFDDETLTIMKTHTYQTHLRLVNKQIASLEAPHVNNVDIRTAGATKLSGNEVTGATGKAGNKYEIKAVATAPVALTRGSHKLKNVESSSPQSGNVRTQPKRNRQYRNREKRHRPTGIQVGEVKQMKIESFPTAAELPDDGLLFDDLGVVTQDDVQKSENKGTRGLIPVAVTLKTKGRCSRKVLSLRSTLMITGAQRPLTSNGCTAD